MKALRLRNNAVEMARIAIVGPFLLVLGLVWQVHHLLRFALKRR